LEALEDRALLSITPYLPQQHNLMTMGGYLTGPSTAAPVTIAENYLRSHATSMGLVSADFDEYLVTTNYVTQMTGATTLTFAQMYNGLQVFNSNFNITVAADGRLLSIGGGWVPGLSARPEQTPAPSMTSNEAIVAAANVLGLSMAQPPSFVSQPSSGSSVWRAPDLSLDDITATLRYVPVSENDVTLSWNLTVRTPDNSHWYSLDVNSTSGGLAGLVDYASHAVYEVYGIPGQNPDEGPRTLETDPHIISPTPAPVPSPFGWHDTNGVAGPEFTTTQGNNVNAYADRDADDLPDAGSQPDGGATLDFSGALVGVDFTQEPQTYTAAAVTNLFYWSNVLHDVHYLYGFDEAARNFQVNNYGRGGAGNDAVNAEAQDGSGLNNANFATPPDGTAPRMQMFEFNITSPRRDGDFENQIIIHEYGHGVSNRLTGNGNGLFALQSGGMGEGWSDFWALMLTQKSASETTTGRGAGTYVLGQPLNGPGIRDFRYDFDIGNVNEETFLDFGTGSGQSVAVHDAGTRWAAVLWDLNHLLTERYGFEPNVYNSNSDAGNIKALHLVMNALKIQPLNPTFIQARDAILAADELLYGGANILEIWTAFARRGLGQFASTSGANSTVLSTSFVIPPEAFRNLAIGDVAQVEGHSGSTQFVFAVTLSSTTNTDITVQYQTVAGTATSGVDFTPVSGTLTFAANGPLVQNITVEVFGDNTAEDSESFIVRLFSPSSSTISKADGIGTIINDDLEFRVADAGSILEGNGGVRNAVFAVSTFGTVQNGVSINYTTLNGTATAGTDFQPRAGAITFAPGGGTVNVTVPLVADALNESTETFQLLLVSPQGGLIADGTGTATIIDDDGAPALYVNDVQVTTTESGILAAVFTVALNVPSGQNVYVNVGTSDNTAFSGQDYQEVQAALVFAPGVTSQTVTVPILTSAVYSPDKTFLVNLFAAVNAGVGDPQGVGRIVFAPPPVNEFILDDGDAGYTRSAGWTDLTNTLSYGLDYDYHAAGNGNGHATWTFNNIPQGTYQVFAKWIPFSNRATNAPYTILDGSTPLATVLVNQQQLPTGELSNGISWQSLGFFSTSTGTLAVRLRDNANGYVIADAIRLVKDGIATQVPEMDVSSIGRSIGTSDVSPTLEDGTDFGVTPSLANSVTHTFTISNTGNAPLQLTGSPRVQVLGPHAQDFTVIVQPAESVAPGGVTNFQVIFDPTEVGVRQAVISIWNNDDSENPYQFVIQGTGTTAGPANWIIDDAGQGFTAVPGWESIAVGGAYQGSALVMEPTGDAISSATWTFGGLAPGRYDVYTTWAPAADLASNARFRVIDSIGSYHVLQVNQKLAPSIPLNGTNWGTLGSIDLQSGTLMVELTNDANGPVMADAVLVVRHDAPIQPGELLAHNAAMPLDVNADGSVSSFDALLVINQLLVQSAAPQASTFASGGAGYYTDVNGDGLVSPRDALLVISRLLNPVPQAAAALATGSAADAGELAAIDAAVSQMDDGEAAAEEPLRRAVVILPHDEESAVPPAAANLAAVSAVFEAVEAADEDEADLLVAVAD